MIHCYCFANDVEFEKEIKERLIKYLGAVPAQSDELTMRKVRNVSPHKDMFCVSFRLPKGIAVKRKEEKVEKNETVTGKRVNTEFDCPPPLKKQKTDLMCGE